MNKPLIEIMVCEKCTVICANCHRVVHYSDRFGGNVEVLWDELGKINRKLVK
jgi:predicted HNH restriction endonuclease